MICQKFRSSSNFFGKKKEVVKFINNTSAETYLYRSFPDNTRELERVMDINDVGKLNDDDTLVQVTNDIFDVEWSYAGLRSGDGEDIDLTVSAACRINEPRAFLNGYAMERLTTTDSINVTSLENTLIQSCRQPLSDEISSLNYDALKNQDALPAGWWLKKLPDWIGCGWLELKEIKSVSYQSATADKEKQIKKQQKLQELESEALRQQHERELTLRQQQTQFETAKKEIEADARLSEQQRQTKIEELEQQRQKKKLESDIEMEQARLKAEKEKAQVEAEIEEIRHRTDSAKEVLRQAEEAEKRNNEMQNNLKEAMAQLSELAEVTKDAMKENQETSSAIREDRQQRERLGVSVSKMSSQTMELIGKTLSPEYFAQVLREKAGSAARGVMMKKVELTTRDIGVRKVDSLAVNSPLQFEFMPRESGYATVINIGTSGKVWLHSPNAYVGIGKAKVKAGKKYNIPGELLPGEDLSRSGLQYLEVGPPGWEELVVIVTAEPLVTEADIYESTPQNPFSLLSSERVDAMLDQLADMPEESWQAGILSFLVEA